MDSFMDDIGFNIVKSVEDMDEWKHFIRVRIGRTKVSEGQSDLFSRIKKHLSAEGDILQDEGPLQSLLKLIRECHRIVCEDEMSLDEMNILVELLNRIIKTFDEGYCAGTFLKIIGKSRMNDLDKMRINCVTLTITLIGQFYRVMKDKFNQVEKVIIEYLSALREAESSNNVASRIVHICLYTLCDIKEGPNFSRDTTLWKILWSYFTKFRDHANIRLASSILLANNSSLCLDNVARKELSTFLSEIVDSMKKEGSTSYLAFSEKKISDAAQLVKPRQSSSAKSEQRNIEKKTTRSKSCQGYWHDTVQMDRIFQLIEGTNSMKYFSLIWSDDKIKMKENVDKLSHSELQSHYKRIMEDSHVMVPSRRHTFFPDMMEERYWMNQPHMDSMSSSLMEHFMEDTHVINHYELQYRCRNLMEQMAEASGTNPLFFKERYLYFSDIVVPLIHVRLFVVPSMITKKATGSSSTNERSLEYLEKVLYDRLNFLKYCNTKLSLDVMECMMDLLEDISKKSIQDERIRSLTDVMIPFMGYYRVMGCYRVVHPHKYERDIKFLEAYLDEDGPTKLWSAVLLCLQMKKHESIQVLRKYLEKEAVNPKRISDDTVIVYAAAQQSASNSDWRTLTNTDYRLMMKLRECDPALFDVRSSISDRIYGIFNYQYKEMMKSFEKDTPLTECLKIAIKCLCLSQPFLKKFENLILALLKEARPFVTKNIASTRITEIILYEMSQWKEEAHKDNKTDEVCREYLSIKYVSEEIRLSSSVLMCLTRKYHETVHNFDQIIEYLSDIIENMKVQGRGSHLGFYEAELENALTQAYGNLIFNYEDDVIDLELMKKLQSFGVSEICKKILSMNILRIFDEKHKESVFEQLKVDGCLSEIQNSKMSGLTLSVAFLSEFKDSISSRKMSKYLNKYLGDLREYKPYNEMVLTVVQMFLSALCKLSSSDNLEYCDGLDWTLINIYISDTNEIIKLRSGYLMVFLYNRDKTPQIGQGFVKEIISYLKKDMEKDEADVSSVFALGEIEISEMNLALENINFISNYLEDKTNSELIEKLRSLSDISTKDDKTEKIKVISLPIKIIGRFREMYEKKIFAKMKVNEGLSEIEHSKMTCLTLSVAFLSKIKDSDSSKMVAQHIMENLRNLGGYIPFSRTVLTVTQILLYALCNLSRNDEVELDINLGSTLLTFFTSDTNERIKLLSGYLMVFLHNRDKTPMINHEDMRVVVDYLKVVFEKMEEDKTDRYLGFTRGEREISEMNRALKGTQH